MGNSPKRGRNLKLILTIGGIILILASVISIILFLLHGSITVSSKQTGDNVEIISCENNNSNYPIFDEENLRWNVKINAILENNVLEKISLILKIHLANEKDVTKTWVNSSKAIEEQYAKDGLNIDSLNMQFSDLENNYLQMTLYAEKDMIGNATYKYFMLNELTDYYTTDTIQQLYTEQNFNCNIVK